LESSIWDDGSSGEGFSPGPSCLVALRANDDLSKREDGNFESRIAPFLNKNCVFRLCILLPPAFVCDIKLVPMLVVVVGEDGDEYSDTDGDWT
jgi:hypothetical protein